VGNQCTNDVGCCNNTRVCVVPGGCECRFGLAPCPLPPTEAPTKNPTPPPGFPTLPPSEAPTRAPTVAPTTSICSCYSDLCKFETCVNPTTGQCSSTNTSVDCVQTLKDLQQGIDYCTIVTGPCTLPSGCSFGPVDCSGVSHTPCEIVVADPLTVGCCKKVPVICPSDGCFTYTCNIGTGLCDKVSTCLPSADKCIAKTCDGTNCITKPTICTNTSCVTYSCLPATGLCVPTPKNCNDNNPCTVDTCGPLGCVNTAINCNIGTDPCLTYFCDKVTGKCGTTPNKCDDGIACTDDVCTPGVGCASTPNDILCTNTDPCVNKSVCNVTAKGCTITPTICGKQGLFCTLASCIPNSGCSGRPRDCTGNVSNKSCDTFNCSELNRTCTKKSGTCFNFIGVIAGIVVGAVIGGVIGAAALLFFASVSGTAYAVSSSYNRDETHSVKHNPLFQSATKGNEVQL